MRSNRNKVLRCVFQHWWKTVDQRQINSFYYLCQVIFTLIKIFISLFDLTAGLHKIGYAKDTIT